MSYTPPAGNAIAFVATGVVYTPPAGNAVNFSLGGGEPPATEFTLTGFGAVTLGGSAQLQFVVRWSGAIRISGKAVLNSGRALSAAGAIRLQGKAALNVGRVFSAHGGLELHGAAAFRRGVSLHANGAVVLGGAATLTASAMSLLMASGGIKLGGGAVLDAPRKGWPASLAVLTRPSEVLHVLG